MRALVVFETMFGNTAAIGEAVAVALRGRGVEAEAEAVTRVDPSSTGDVDLLVVGGPTHAHGMSRAATRKAGAADQKNSYPDPTIDPGLREWLERIPPGGDRMAAAFDTRLDKPEWLTGSAAKGMGKRLLRQGSAWRPTRRASSSPTPTRWGSARRPMPSTGERCSPRASPPRRRGEALLRRTPVGSRRG